MAREKRGLHQSREARDASGETGLSPGFSSPAGPIFNVRGIAERLRFPFPEGFSHAVSNLLLWLFFAAALNGCAHLNGNLQTVEPGAYYRSGQMNATVLDITLRRHGIGTVVNLRGKSPGEAWYREELAVCLDREVAHHGLDWTMKRPPEPASLQTLIGILQEGQPPFLVHCQGGTHRAAVAAACYRLLRGESVEAARRELGLFFNDAPIGQLLDLYEQSGLPFQQWVFEEYPVQYQALGY